jgi:hypothetical protein
LDRGKRDKNPVITPEVPTRGSVGHAIFDHHAHGQIDDAMGVMATGWGQIGEIDVEILLTR